MYFSAHQIRDSIELLNKLNPFFGTVFLAFKHIDIHSQSQPLPVGQTASFPFISHLDTFLRRYYKPLNEYDGFYTPFKTSNSKKRWNTYQYANTLHRVTVDTFADVILHPKGTQAWGWKTDYVQILSKEHLALSLIPTFDLAVWMFRFREWPVDVTPQKIIETFLTEFQITVEEKVLFNQTKSFFKEDDWLQNEPVETAALLSIIGSPSPEYTRINSTNIAEAEEGAKLRHLTLRGIGPAEEFDLFPSPRLNIITGDNALGKTFLLECIWWILTNEWASRNPAYPHPDHFDEKAEITFQISKEDQDDVEQTIHYDRKKNNWERVEKRLIFPGLTLYAQSDGSFAVYDVLKQSSSRQLELFEADSALYITPSPQSTRHKARERPFLSLTAIEVWYGVTDKQSERNRSIFEGLLRGWIEWQNDRDQTRFEKLQKALKTLSPHFPEPLSPGKPDRSGRFNDDRPMPTLRFPYGDVPLVLCSAGIKRIVALAYMLVWAWDRHVMVLGEDRETSGSMVLLIDETEAHLHPFWQRTVVPALMNVVQDLVDQIDVQVMLATHSPLVLASVEPIFDEEQDSLFHLSQDYQTGEVQLDEVPFFKRGRVDYWLMSEIFGLKHPRSIEAEGTIERAKALQLEPDPDRESVQKVTDDLVRYLAGDDDFWPRWTYFAEKQGARFDTSQEGTGAG